MHKENKYYNNTKTIMNSQEFVDYQVHVKSCIDEIVKRIVNNFDPKKIILFGSQARGTMDKHSDVDILVVMEDGIDTEKTALEIMRVKNGVMIGTDIIVTTPTEIEQRGNVCGFVLYYALKEGVVLYERQC